MIGNTSTGISQVQDQKMGCDSWTFKLPFQNQNVFNVGIDLGTASKVLEYDESKMTLSKKSGVKLEGEGYFVLNVNLIDF